LPGANPGDLAGFSVAALADNTGDGVMEILVGEPLLAPAGSQGVGRVVVYDGGSQVVLNNILAPLSAVGFGKSIAGIGDASGDGLNDVIVGAPDPGAAGERGNVYVMDAALPSQIQYVWSGPQATTIPWGDVVANVGDLTSDQVPEFAFHSSVDLGGGIWENSVHVVDGSTGQTLFGGPLAAPAGVTQFGSAIAGTGDLNGDGTPDLAIGGSSLSLFSGLDGTPISVGVLPRADSLAVVGDVSPIPDGIDDLALGEPGFASSKGQVVVVDGASLAVLFATTGVNALDRFGQALARVDDVNGDGLPEILAGAPQTVTAPGYARLLSGSSGCGLGTYVGAALGDGFGSAVASVGDVDLDGIDDIAVGAPTEDPGGLIDAGAARVFRHKWFGAAVGTKFCLCASSVCGNQAPNSGCQNSATPYGVGGLLEGFGSTSITANDLFLVGSSLRPNQFCLPVFSTNEIGPYPMNDGLMCLGNTIVRMYPTLRADSNGTVIVGPCITSDLGLGAGTQVSFQLWYRDPKGPCATGSNLTNGVRIVLTP